MRATRPLLAALLGAALATTSCSADQTGAGSSGDASPSATSTSSGAPATSPTPGAPSTAAASAGPSSPSPSPTTDLSVDPGVVLAATPVPVLDYHQVRPYRADDTDVDRVYIMPPEVFTEQLDALAAGGWTTVTPDDVLAHVTTRAPLPEKPVLLTFDDGVDEHFDLVLPALQQRGMVAAFFPMTVVLDKEDWLSSDEVRQIHDAGMTVGAHTYDHQRLDRLTGREEVAEQVVAPREELSGIVGEPVRYLAYPYGVWDAAALDAVQGAGYDAAFQLDGEPLDAARPLLTLRRQIANPSWSGPELVAALQAFA